MGFPPLRQEPNVSRGAFSPPFRLQIKKRKKKKKKEERMEEKN